MTVRYVPPRVPITDPRTGMISREWYLFFQGIMGGTDQGGTVEELSPPSLSPEILAPLIAALERALSVTPVPPVPVLPDTPLEPAASLVLDRIATIEARLDGMSQGGPVL